MLRHTGATHTNTYLVTYTLKNPQTLTNTLPHPCTIPPPSQLARTWATHPHPPSRRKTFPSDAHLHFGFLPLLPRPHHATVHQGAPGDKLSGITSLRRPEHMAAAARLPQEAEQDKWRSWPPHLTLPTLAASTWPEIQSLALHLLAQSTAPTL